MENEVELHKILKIYEYGDCLYIRKKRPLCIKHLKEKSSEQNKMRYENLFFSSKMLIREVENGFITQSNN